MHLLWCSFGQIAHWSAAKSRFPGKVPFYRYHRYLASNLFVISENLVAVEVAGGVLVALL